MPGIQSTKVTWTGASISGGDPHGDLACADRIAEAFSLNDPTTEIRDHSFRVSEGLGAPYN